MELFNLIASSTGGSLSGILANEAIVVVLITAVLGPAIIVLLQHILKKFGDKKEREAAKDDSVKKTGTEMRVELRDDNKELRRRISETYQPRIAQLEAELDAAIAANKEINEMLEHTDGANKELLRKNEMLNFELIMLTKEVLALKAAIIKTFENTRKAGEQI